MNKTTVTFVLISLLSAVATFAAPADAQSIVGRWKRTGDQGQWVMYEYRQDGNLLRANETQTRLTPFGKYRAVAGHIYFRGTPENYTPVRFVVQDGTCSGYAGETLFLFDKDTGRAYGCYFKVESSADSR